MKNYIKNIHYFCTLIMLIIYNNTSANSNDSTKVITLDKHVFVIEIGKINSKTGSVYSLYDSTFNFMLQNDTIISRISVFDKSTYLKEINPKLDEESKLNSYKKINDISIIYKDSIFTQFDSLSNLYFKVFTYSISFPKKYSIIASENLNYTMSGSENTGEFYIIELVDNLKLIYGSVYGLMTEDKPKSEKVYFDTVNYFWAIVK